MGLDGVHGRALKRARGSSTADSGRPRVRLRPVTVDDADLLARLITEAENWSGEQRVRVDSAAEDPAVGRYVADWGRDGDMGVIAVDEEPLGGAWARLFTGQAPGWGYVADDVPEVCVAVLPAARGRGAGAAVLDGCLDLLRAHGFRAVSLSVEDGNDRARAMYERRGFRVVGRVENSDTMLLGLT